MPIVIVLLTAFVRSYFGRQEEKYFPDFKRFLHSILLYPTLSYPKIQQTLDFRKGIFFFFYIKVSSVLGSIWQNRNGPLIKAAGTTILAFSMNEIWGFTPAKIQFATDNTLKPHEVLFFCSASVLIRYRKTFGACFGAELTFPLSPKIFAWLS